jgi:cellulose synthase operon protein C
MSTPCEQVHAFVDGQLGPEEADRFRFHLPDCATCQVEMNRIIQLDAAVQDVLEPPRRTLRPVRTEAFRPRWSVRAGPRLLLLATAVAVGGLVLFSRLPFPSRDEGAWLTQAPTRTLEARLAWPAADRHRPYETLRSGRSGSGSSPPLRELARLEEAGDYEGLAAAWLLAGEPAQADSWLARSGDSPAADNDRAVLALERGEYAEALALLDRVLRSQPEHPQARWNRGLVLERLELPMSAARDFERIAALGEPGWADEARQRAETLRARSVREWESWRGANALGRELVRGGPLPSDEEVARHPGLFRLYLYDAVRSARTAQRVRELQPLAQALDTRVGGTVLQDFLRQVEARDFGRRAPLAEAYESLALAPQAPAVTEELLERLRRAGEPDLLLGTLVQAGAVAAHLDEFRALAAASRDPWFELMADQEQGRALAARGETREAERLLLAALERCGQARLSYRCTLLESELAALYRRLHRPAEAYRHGLEGRRFARDEHATYFDWQLLMELGQVSRLRDQDALSRAWLDEAAEAEPKDCGVQHFVRSSNAGAFLTELRVDEARREMDQALRCGGALTLPGALALADLARSRPGPEDAAWMEKGVAALRSSERLSPGEKALAAQALGRFLLESHRSEGEALLRQALAEAARLSSRDVEARKTRAYGYTALLLAAGKAGEYERALALLEEEAGAPLPARCLLGLTVDDERTLLVARGPDGALSGRYDASRTAPLTGVAGLIPEDFLRPLRACEHLTVLARPPLHGRSELLPDELAWSYLVTRPAVSPVPALPSRRLVVAEAQVPAELRLAPLRLWRTGPPGEADTVELLGAAATPDRVLEEMRRATEIELHVHGLLRPEVSDAPLLVLSPEAGGREVLTADEIRARRLEGAPLVTLAACGAARSAPFLHEPFSLPAAFIEAGARTVFAATADIPDQEAAAFFSALRGRMRAGAPAALALRDERLEWLRRGGSDWVRHVLLFE